MRLWALVATAALSGALHSAAAAAQEAAPTVIGIGFLKLAGKPLTLSLLDLPTADDGIAGAKLAIEDNNTTGRFTGQSFVLHEAVAASAEEAVAAFESLAAAGIRFVVADLPAATLLSVADAAAQSGTLVFNAGAADDALRQEQCRANVVHTAPSRSMLADGLAQYLVWKKWPRWLLLVGSHEADQLYAEAVRRAAQRFGGQIVEERLYEDTGGARRTDSGHLQVQRQMPVFTQSAAAHDVVVVADESEVFGAYVAFRTWEPRPVAGTAGLRATSWSPAHDQWGAIQLQNRFNATFRRWMTAKDMQAWTAVRMVGEAATRSNSGDPAKLREFILGPDFAVAAFKGQKLTLRDWDLQLRQPILLADGHTVVSVSPQEGFLHQTSELDTLGHDRPESQCRL